MSSSRWLSLRWRTNKNKKKKKKMVPLLAILAHRYPRGWFYKILTKLSKICCCCSFFAIINYEMKWIIIRKWTIFTLNRINYRFRSTIGIKTRNYWKIIDMAIISSLFNSIQFWKKLLNWIAFWKKIWHWIDSVNWMHDPDGRRLFYHG